MKKLFPFAVALPALATLFLGIGCQFSETSAGTINLPASQINLQPEHFLQDGLAAAITTQACKLSGGTQTECYRIAIKGVPANSPVGPFCPPTITASAEEGGIWFDGSGDVYELDGAFITGLAELYGADWQLYDPVTGKVKVTDTERACRAAARPNVAPEYQNHCVECSLDYVDGGVTTTLLIPVVPVLRAKPSRVGRASVGVALNGVLLDAPAPVHAILKHNTIAAFDDCGGHINPHVGYHYHAATGCSEVTTGDDGHANLLGYALDGFAIYAMLDSNGEEPTDLDECRGHTDDVRGYHYHAASAGENMFIGCFRGEYGEVVGARRGPPRPPPR